MERLSVPCLRTGHGSTVRHQHPGCHSLLVQKKFAYEMPPSLQQIPTCRTFCFKNLGFLPSRLVRAPGKKAHRLMTPHLWSTLQGAPWIIHMHFGTIHAKCLGALPGEAQLNLQQIDQASTASSQSYLSGIVALVAVMSTWMLFVIHICVAADSFLC